MRVFCVIERLFIVSLFCIVVIAQIYRFPELEFAKAYLVDSVSSLDPCGLKTKYFGVYNIDVYRAFRRDNTITLIVCAERPPIVFFAVYSVTQQPSRCEEILFEEEMNYNKWRLSSVVCDAKLWISENNALLNTGYEKLNGNIMAIGSNVPFVFSTATGKVVETKTQYFMLYAAGIFGGLFVVLGIVFWFMLCRNIRQNKGKNAKEKRGKMMKLNKKKHKRRIDEDVEREKKKKLLRHL